MSGCSRRSSLPPAQKAIKAALVDTNWVLFSEGVLILGTFHACTERWTTVRDKRVLMKERKYNMTIMGISVTNSKKESHDEEQINHL